MRRLAPPPKLSLSEWADTYRYLPPETAAEAGKWHTSRAEYLREMMDAISDPSVERVVVMASARVGKTELINNLIGYHIHQDPAPILMVYPALEAAEEWSRDKFAPMVRDTPVLRAKMPTSKSRDAHNKTLHKSFPGGRLYIVGANAPTGLAAKNIRVVCCDEVDRYTPNAEGDPVDQAVKRATNFWNRKIVLVSSPKDAGTSRIESLFLASDQRRYYVPCPHCNHAQTLKWSQVRWQPNEPQTALYHCEECGAGWTDGERHEAIRAAKQNGGGWRATGVFRGTAGFHLSELYSPWRRMSETVSAFLEASRRTDTLRVWVNTALGEPWIQRGDAPEAERLHQAREDRLMRTVPPGALLLTCGADVQADRVEWDVWAWGFGLTAWLVDSGVIQGSPSAPETWRAMREVSERRYPDQSGRLWPIDATGVDSGYMAHAVYQFVASHPDRQRVFALKGRADLQMGPLGSPSAVDIDYEGRKIGSTLLWPVGTHGLKLEHYGAIRRALEGPGDDGWPEGALRITTAQDTDYCQQLTAEVLETVNPRGGGAARLQWRRVPNVRNERLDTAIYARALAHHLTDTLRPEDWAARAMERGVDMDAARRFVSERFGPEALPHVDRMLEPPKPAPMRQENSRKSPNNGGFYDGAEALWG